MQASTGNLADSMIPKILYLAWCIAILIVVQPGLAPGTPTVKFLILVDRN